MKKLSVLWRILSHACAYYTVASLTLYTAGMLVSGIEHEWIPTMKMMYLLLAFSILFSAVNDLVQHTKLPTVLKVLIHYAATTLIFYVMFILWGGYSATPSSVLVILLAYTLLYAAVALILFTVRTVLGVKKSNTTAYKRQFDEKSAK